MEKKETMGKVEILLATIIWGFAFVVIRDALTVVPFHMLMVWRYTIAVAMMVLLFRKQIRKVDRELLFEGAVLGLLLYISQCFQTGALGFADTTAGKVGFITSLYVVQVPLFNWIYSRGKRKIRIFGFATDDYMLWPAVTWGLLTIVMLMGACAGSTTGGLKCIRMVILGKVARNEFKHILHPNAILPVRINKQVISPSIQSTVLAFCFIYAVIIIISVLIMMGMGIGFVESVGCVVSSIGNMGPGLGETGPAFSWNALPDVAKWLMAFLMLLGRLELFTVLLLFTPEFWRRS